MMGRAEGRTPVAVAAGNGASFCMRGAKPTLIVGAVACCYDDAACTPSMLGAARGVSVGNLLWTGQSWTETSEVCWNVPDMKGH